MTLLCANKGQCTTTSCHYLTHETPGGSSKIYAPQPNCPPEIKALITPLSIAVVLYFLVFFLKLHVILTSLVVVQVEGVSMPHLLEALRDHCRQWHSTQGELKDKGARV